MSFRDATQNAMYSASTYLLRLLFQRLIRFRKRPHLIQIIIVPCGLERGSGQSDDEPDEEGCQGQSNTSIFELEEGDDAAENGQNEHGQREDEGIDGGTQAKVGGIEHNVVEP